MLRGKRTGLRARAGDDTEILHAELYEDVQEWVRGSTRPWVPLPAGPGSPYAASDTEAGEAGLASAVASDAAEFSIVELATRELAGAATLWGIDTHNRMAHIGIELRPTFRGRGLGADAVRVLCRYGFALRGLHRLQLETLADNHAMIAVAEKLGFTREGTMRGSSWVNGGFADDVIFGLLAEELGRLAVAQDDDHPQERMSMHRYLRTWEGSVAGLCTANPPLPTALATASAGVAHRSFNRACGKLLPSKR
jgi:RimJ/RimL family protein N-acetyltransferase